VAEARNAVAQDESQTKSKTPVEIAARVSPRVVLPVRIITHWVSARREEANRFRVRFNRILMLAQGSTQAHKTARPWTPQ
jgi:hypothetical protein